MNQEVKEETIDNQRDVDWVKVLFYVHILPLSIFGLHLCIVEKVWITAAYSFLLIFLAHLGVTAGAHRLWTHSSYEANKSLKVILMLWQTLAGQGPVYDWVLQHRLHHKYYETQRDPYNTSKGFWYSHFLCLIQTDRVDKKQVEDTINVADLEEDSVVMFQKRNYWLLLIILKFMLVIYVPMYFWNEYFYRTIFVAGFMRYGITLNLCWLIHSAKTIWALKRTERKVLPILRTVISLFLLKNIFYPPDSNMVFVVNKNYWLYYHYIVPWDYQTSEYSKYGEDFTSSFIRVSAALGLACNLRTVSSEMVKSALNIKLDTNKPISDCIEETTKFSTISPYHYLQPMKTIN